MLPTDPRRLLFVDGIGALVTALSMAFLLAPLEGFFGLPASAAYALAFIGCLFAAYSLSNGARKKANYRQGLATIARANLSYCALSVLLLFVHAKTLSVFGHVYLLGEVVIVTFLARYELEVATAK